MLSSNDFPERLLPAEPRLFSGQSPPFLGVIFAPNRLWYMATADDADEIRRWRKARVVARTGLTERFQLKRMYAE